MKESVSLVPAGPVVLAAFDHGEPVVDRLQARFIRVQLG